MADDIMVEVKTLTALRRIVRALRSSGSAAERRAGVTAAQQFVLQQLAAKPEQSITELMAATLTTQSSVSEVVQRLIGRGLVSRRQASADARRVVLGLTARGHAAVRAVPDSAQASLVAGLGKMSRAKRRQLAELLEEWVSAARIDRTPATMFLEEVPTSNNASIVPRARASQGRGRDAR